MAKAPTFIEMKDHYRKLWATVEIDKGQEATVDRVAAAILKNKARYQAVASKVGDIPWYWIGLVHNLEAGRSFNAHLHNGDPLTGRTYHVPAGRPLKGEPPFTWEESAVDALLQKGLDKVDDWSIERMLYEAERYNGWGYWLYHRSDLSPYVWSKTNHNDGSGKYVADGKWSATAPSEQQVGFAAGLKALMEIDDDTDRAPKQEPKPLTRSKGIWGTILSIFGITAETAQKAVPDIQPYIEFHPAVKYIFIGCVVVGATLTLWSRLEHRIKHGN